ncbi:bifunctional DNA primase/polymerase [Sutcliffiella horikoshii]|uniref:bifunctional DNA primase/polymerase n=1 Tax=Sutcliffiella horikoshii TaxID=79883 RepID=UPI00384C2A35
MPIVEDTKKADLGEDQQKTLPEAIGKQSNFILTEDFAERYYNLGFSIFTLKEKSKEPKYKWAHYQATRAEFDDILLMLKQQPNSNLAIVTGAISDLLVLDVDDIEAAKNSGWEQLPKTPTVSTGKGLHYYFKHPGIQINNNKGKLAKFCDIRCDGGYVVAPPSIHPSGRMYEWVKGREPWNCALAEVPEWLLEKLKNNDSPKKQQNTSKSSDSQDNEITTILSTSYKEGEGRNDAVTKLAGHFFGKGMPFNEVFQLIEMWNSKNSPPLDVKELTTTIKSIHKTEESKNPSRSLPEDWRTLLEGLRDYSVNKNGHLCSIKYDKEGGTILSPLSNFVARPTREVIKDDGVDTTITIEIEGLLNGDRKLPKVVVPADKFAPMHWVTTEWGIQANLYPGPANKDKVRHFIQSLATNIETGHIYTHTGWRKIKDKWVYLHGNGAVGAEKVQVELTDSLQHYKLPTKVENLQEAIKWSLKALRVADKHITYPLLAMVGLAPLCEPFRKAGHEPSFVLWLLGESGAKKSTLTALFLSHFGDFNSSTLPGSFKDTANALEKKSFLTKDTIFVVDDYHPNSSVKEANNMQQLAQQILRGYGDHHGRARMQANLDFKTTYIPRGLGIVTGEDIPTAGTSTTARFISTEVKRDSVELELLTQLQSNKHYLQESMYGYLEWLSNKMDSLPELLEKAFLEERKNVSMEDVHPRLAAATAWLSVGLQAFLNYAEEMNVITEEEKQKYVDVAGPVFMKLLGTHASNMTEETPSQLFIKALLEMRATGKVRFEPVIPPAPKPGQDFEKVEGELVGYEDEEFIYLIPGTSYTKVFEYYMKQGRKFPLTPKMTWKGLASDNLIVEREEGKSLRTSLRKSINGKQERLVWMMKSQLEEQEEN